MKVSNFESKVYIGTVDNEEVYLSEPEWACGWYWGFGYLGNKDNHYHVDGLNRYENINMFDAMKKHFNGGLSKKLQDDENLWKFCELMRTFYALKGAAEVLGRGGSHYTTNPCAEIIKNKEEVTRINTVVLPAIFNAIYKIIH